MGNIDTPYTAMQTPIGYSDTIDRAAHTSGGKTTDAFNRIFQKMASWFSTTDHDKAQNSFKEIYFGDEGDATLCTHFDELSNLAGDGQKHNFVRTSTLCTVDLSSLGEETISFEVTESATHSSSWLNPGKLWNTAYECVPSRSEVIEMAIKQITLNNALGAALEVGSLCGYLSKDNKALISYAIPPVLDLGSRIADKFIRA